MPLRESERHLTTKPSGIKGRFSVAAELSRESVVSVLYRHGNFLSNWKSAD